MGGVLLSVTFKRESNKNKTIFEKALKDLDRKVGKVGWFESAKYADGTPVAYVAAIQEFGDPAQHIPPRPFMRPAISNNQNIWKLVAQEKIEQVLNGELKGRDVLEAVGLRASGDIRKNISELQDPPLRPSTIANRLKARADKKTIGLLTKPLVDSGILLNSLTNTVENE
jgi:hypothetical protein